MLAVILILSYAKSYLYCKIYKLIYAINSCYRCKWYRITALSEFCCWLIFALFLKDVHKFNWFRYNYKQSLGWNLLTFTAWNNTVHLIFVYFIMHIYYSLYDELIVYHLYKKLNTSNNFIMYYLGLCNIFWTFMYSVFY